MASNSDYKRFTVLGQGNNGAVLQGSLGQVYKWSVDPVEIRNWLAVQSLRTEGVPLSGFPEVFNLHLGDRCAVITRETVSPFVSMRAGLLLDSYVVNRLQAAGREITAGRLAGKPRRALAGRGLLLEGLSVQRLQPIRDSIQPLIDRYRVYPGDVRPSNLGRIPGRRNAVVLHDLGRSPIETLAVAPGEAAARCPNATALGDAVKETLGRAPSYGKCKIVGPADLRSVMNSHGWRDAEINGTAGFHTEPSCNLLGRCTPGDILIRKGNEWSLLHELVHAAGIDKGLSSWFIEGLTEATAQHIAEAHGLKHHPTYFTEVEQVKTIICPTLGVDVPALARMVLASPKRVARTIAAGLSASLGDSEQSWFNAVGHTAGSVADFKKAVLHARDHRANKRRKEARAELSQ